MFDNYSRIVSESKHKAKDGEGLKILSSKQMLQRLTIALPQAKAGKTSKNVLNEMRQRHYKFFVTSKRNY